MNKNVVNKTIIITLLISSLILISWSCYKIYSTRNSFEESINTWDYEEKNLHNNGISVENEESVNVASSNGLRQNLKNVMGKIFFKANNKEVPLINGTERSDLSRGAGYYKKSSLPGDNGNCIIFGHRETAFRVLKNSKIDDIVQIQTENGTFNYRIYDIKVVKPYDEFITKRHEEQILTLVTCYPFNLIGSAPERYVIKAKLIK